MTTDHPQKITFGDCALGDAPIYKGIRNDFDIKVFGRDDLGGTV